MQTDRDMSQKKRQKMKPKRIQRKRTKGWKMPKNTIYVGRGTKWGNPYIIWKMYRVQRWIVSRDCTGEHYVDNNSYRLAVECAVERYRKYICKKIESGELDISELKGKNLACWCPIFNSKGDYCECHADVLLALANNLTIEDVRNENINLKQRILKGIKNE